MKEIYLNFVEKLEHDMIYTRDLSEEDHSSSSNGHDRAKVFSSKHE